MGNKLSQDEINLALHDAAEKGDIEKVKQYVQQGADLNKLIVKNYSSAEREKSREEATQSSAAKDNDAGAKRNASKILRERSRKKRVRMNAMHRSAKRKNNFEVMEYISERIANIDDQDSNGDTCLHYAAMFHNNIKCVSLILRSKPNINRQNDKGETALLSAVTFGCDLATIEELLKFGADPNIPNMDGYTCLHVCALQCGIDPLIPGVLLRYGGNPNLKNKHGQTALHVAAESSNIAVLLLLKFNAKVRLRDNNGNRPSEVAASEEIRKILLEEEDDLQERTTRTSDIVEAVEVSTFSRSRPQSARSLSSWNSDQVPSLGLDEDGDRLSRSRYERESTSQVLYPRRSIRQETSYQGRLSRPDIDPFKELSGSGGKGTLVLPENKEIVIPPDAVPRGTCLKVSIKQNKPSAVIPDFDDFDFEFDLQIELPGTSFLSSWINEIRERNPSTAIQPAFSGMCLEGNTSWQCIRELSDEPDTDVKLNFCMKKEKCTPLVKKISVMNPIELTAELPERTYSDKTVQVEKIPEETDVENGSDESDAIFRGVDMSSGNFWSRQVVVVREASDTSGSYDGSDNDSFAERDENLISELRLEDDDMPITYGDAIIEMEDNPRIHHPIDTELATITEEDDTLAFNQTSLEESTEIFDRDYNLSSLDVDETSKKEATPSVDSGYRGSIDFEE